PNRLPLGSCELGDSRGGELDIPLDSLGNPLCAPLDLSGRNENIALPAVELLRILAHRRLAALLDLGEHSGDHLARASAFRLGGLAGPFQVLWRHEAASLVCLCNLGQDALTVGPQRWLS